MKEIKAYKSDDGVIHESLHSAIEADQAISLGDWLFEHPEISWNFACPHEIAVKIIEEFNLTKKFPSN
jgi:hypothetical protein